VQAGARKNAHVKKAVEAEQLRSRIGPTERVYHAADPVHGKTADQQGFHQGEGHKVSRRRVSNMPEESHGHD